MAKSTRDFRALQLPWGTLKLGSCLVIVIAVIPRSQQISSSSLHPFTSPTSPLALHMPVIRNPFRKAAPPTPFNVSAESVITENLSQSTVSLADSGKLSSVEDVRPPRVASVISIPKGPDEGYKLSGGLPQDVHDSVRSSRFFFLFFSFLFFDSLPEAKQGGRGKEPFANFILFTMGH